MYVVVVVGRGLLDECELKCIRKGMRIFTGKGIIIIKWRILETEKR